MDFIWNVLVGVISLIVGAFAFSAITGSIRLAPHQRFSRTFLPIAVWSIILAIEAFIIHSWFYDYRIAFYVASVLAFIFTWNAGKEELKELRTSNSTKNHYIDNLEQIHSDATFEQKKKLFKEAVSNTCHAACKDLSHCELIIEEIMPIADRLIENSKKYISSWGDDFDYEYQAIQTLAGTTFDLLVSGQYHVYRGVLSPVGDSLLNVCLFCLEKIASCGEITREQFDEQLQLLRKKIREVG